MTEYHRRARRAAVRRHHPDVGGSAEALIEALAAFDRGTPRSAIRIRRTRRGRLAAYLSKRRRTRRANLSKKAQR
ncbi:hypothetical protein [Mycolicibacterium mageritense]|uniref:hypothetical protein n=1 Tax=Mycolicibacterium mageritense TaxID=53462 RepID=UPI0011D93BE3|nr:hypothetical protein [Mycolicibacterium mageritense]TXI55680.1 MAG: hypothetical protein E6Q55_30760 [Mycolicibacterium mageritense]